MRQRLHKLWSDYGRRDLLEGHGLGERRSIQSALPPGRVSEHRRTIVYNYVLFIIKRNYISIFIVNFKSINSINKYNISINKLFFEVILLDLLIIALDKFS